MTNTPLVSVLVPAYNHADFVTGCLDSVLAEEYPNKELIVIDDGSTDETADRIRDWLRAHGEELGSPVRFSSRDNRGLAPTLNELLSLARGEFVAPLASDDMLLSGGLRARVTLLERNRHLKAVFGDCTVVNAEGRALYESGLTELHHANKARLASHLAEEIITNWSVPGPVLLCRREALLAIGGWDEALIVEDWDLYLRLVARGWLIFLDVQVAAYRLHGSNTIWDPSMHRQMPTNNRRVTRSALRLFRGRLRLMLLLRYGTTYLDHPNRVLRAFWWSISAMLYLVLSAWSRRWLRRGRHSRRPQPAHGEDELILARESPSGSR